MSHIVQCILMSFSLSYYLLHCDLQMDSLSKVQGDLQYKNEDRINEAIRRLETQHKMHNFNLREEKKIVAEIDRLKRSKKSLVQYTDIKREVDAMRDTARRLREERDVSMNKMSLLSCL